jgi:two-component system, NarL family, nitrate/nitrite response regulator NarL
LAIKPGSPCRFGLLKSDKPDDTMNAPLAPLEVLIVEDDFFFQKVIEEALGSLGRPLLLDRAKSIEEAMHYLRQRSGSYPLALIDLGLPDGDGIDMIGQIRDRFPSTTIMVISVGSEEHRVLDAIRAGASGYVLKGDSNLGLHEAIDQALKGLNPLSPTLARYFLKLASQTTLQKSPQSEIRLTRRERDLLEQFAKGMSYQDAAQQMGVALSTVQTHTRSLYRKLGVRSSLQALSKARQHGLL